MTCIGAIRTIEENGDVTITMGANTRKNQCQYQSGKIINQSGMLIATSGELRHVNLLQHSFKPPASVIDQEPMEYVVTSFIPKFKDVLRKNDCLNYGYPLLLACAGKLFKIHSDFSCSELEYTAIGTNTKCMISALYATKDMKEDEKRLELGLEAIGLVDEYFSRPFHFERITFKGTYKCSELKEITNNPSYLKRLKKLRSLF